MGKSFAEMEREYERMCDKLPGGPGDPELDYDEPDKYDDSDDGEGMTQAKFERKLEYSDLRRKEQREDELMRAISKKGSSKSFRDNFDPRVDGPWHYEGHGSKY